MVTLVTPKREPWLICWVEVRMFAKIGSKMVLSIYTNTSSSICNCFVIVEILLSYDRSSVLDYTNYNRPWTIWTIIIWTMLDSREPNHIAPNESIIMDQLRNRRILGLGLPYLSALTMVRTKWSGWSGCVGWALISAQPLLETSRQCWQNHTMPPPSSSSSHFFPPFLLLRISLLSPHPFPLLWDTSSPSHLHLLLLLSLLFSVAPDASKPHEGVKDLNIWDPI